MIKWGKTPKGEFFGKYQGRGLCSIRNPVKEASQWCDHHDFIKNFAQVTVIGIGLGYHLLELSKRWPLVAIRAFDFKDSLTALTLPVDQSYDLLSLENCELFFAPEARHEWSQVVPLGPVVKFQSACFEEENVIYTKLLGQTPEHFALWSEALNYFSFAELASSIPSNLAVNIKSLPIAPEAYLTENKILNLLKELVQ